MPVRRSPALLRSLVDSLAKTCEAGHSSVASMRHILDRIVLSESKAAKTGLAKSRLEIAVAEAGSMRALTEIIDKVASAEPKPAQTHFPKSLPEAGEANIGSVFSLQNILEEIATEESKPARSHFSITLAEAVQVAGGAGAEGPADPKSELDALRHFVLDLATFVNKLADSAPPRFASEPLPAAYDPSGANPELTEAFFEETRVHLANADVHLLTVEHDPENHEAMGAVFRAYHSIEAGAEPLGFVQMRALAHEAEELMGRARDDGLVLTNVALDVLFETAVKIRRLSSSLRHAIASGTALPPDPDVPILMARLYGVKSEAEPGSAESQGAAPADLALALALIESGAATHEAIVRVLGEQLEKSGLKMFGDVLVDSSVISHSALAEALARQASSEEPMRLGEVLEEMKLLSSQELEEALESQKGARGRPAIGELLVRSGEVAAADVVQVLRKTRAREASEIPAVDERGNVNSAEHLSRLRNGIGAASAAQKSLSETAHREGATLDSIAPELVRMEAAVEWLEKIERSVNRGPLGPLFRRSAQEARDLGRRIAKEFVVRTSGEELELNHETVEAIAGPLLQLVRNSVNHGLEATPEDRLKGGKSSAGVLELRAYRSDNEVVIEVEDDGKGLNPYSILKHARARRLLAYNAAPTQSEIWEQIFMPEFSTATTVYDVPGCGVGLDVVKHDVEALKGRIEVESALGKGTLFRMILPETA